MAPSERRLWTALRGRRFGEAKFRRQVPIGPFIADFACKEARLVIEVDGETHVDQARSAYDVRRTQWFRNQGWEVIRFWTGDLIEMKRTLESIELALSMALSQRVEKGTT